MPSEGRASDVLDGYTRFIGSGSERVIDCVARDRLVGDHDYKPWNGPAIQRAGAR